ncbi:MAG: hypothetical protein EBT66_09190 [Bacteroidetes bacterium]|nr:hypothetical protein [Bacteroidota bacterium]
MEIHFEIGYKAVVTNLRASPNEFCKHTHSLYASRHNRIGRTEVFDPYSKHFRIDGGTRNCPIPAQAYVGCDFYETSHRETLLKQRLSQSWQWCDENGEHNLLLNTEARTYIYALKQVGDRKEIKKSEGSTSSFKKELDVVSQETYYSLYLFDFPQRGHTSMISVDGASAPKIYVTNSKVYELR